MVRAMIFDWDGTIVDNQRMWYEGTCSVFNAFGVTPPSFEKACRTFVIPMAQWYQQFGITVSREEEARLFWERAQGYHDQPLFGDVTRVFDQLTNAGIMIGIVSGTPSGIIAERLHQEKLTDRVRFVLGSSYKKVAPIRTACREFGLCACDAWYVGDRVSDMRDARASGVIPVGITRNYETHHALDEAGATFNIPHLDALFEVVEDVLNAE